MKIVGHRHRSCQWHRDAKAHCGPALQPPRLRSSRYSWASLSTVETEPTAPLRRFLGVPSSGLPAVLSAPFPIRRSGRVALGGQKRSFRGGVTVALRSTAVSPAPTLARTHFPVPRHRPQPNPAVDPVPFGHWTLRDEAAQRRSPLRWGAQGMRQFAPSHLQPLALSPMRLVLPVRKVSALPSFANTRRFAAACASFWHLLRVAPIECPVQVRASRGHTSACVLGRGSVASVGRPLLLGRLAGVT